MQPTFTKDLENAVLSFEIEFAAPVALVWAAWTRSEDLDKWWAPAPWKCESVEMDFRVGGSWHYCMCGPDGERAHGFMNFTNIVPQESFTAQDGFADEQGVVNKELPVATFTVTFTPTETGAKVTNRTVYPTPESMQQVLDMGMEQGMTMALQQLQTLLK